MITIKKMNKICEGTIEKRELSLLELYEYGIDSEDLEELIKRKKLKEIGKDCYVLDDVSELYNYGKQLLKKGDKAKAELTFKRCFDLNPKHYSSYVQLFLKKLDDGDNEAAFQYFDIMDNMENKFRKRDNKFFLYLLNIIMELPDKYKEVVKNLKYGEIRLLEKDNRYDDVIQRNKIRKSLYNKRINYAHTQIMELKSKTDNYNIQDVVIEKLIYKIKAEQYEIKKHLVELTKERKYDEIICYLENLPEKQMKIGENPEVLDIVKDLIEIKRTGVIPKKTIPLKNNFHQYIKSKNYELALWDLIQFRGITAAECDSLGILLIDINNEIEFTKKEESEIEAAEQEELVKLMDSPTIIDIASYLTKQDFYNAFKLINKYLEIKDKKQYQFLIEDLVKISVMNEDTDFITPITTLMYIGLNKLKLNTLDFVDNFYESMKQDQYEEASIYLDIIAKSKNLDQNLVLPSNINTLLDNVSDLLEKKDSNTSVEQYLMTQDKEEIIPKKSYGKRIK